MFDSHAAEFRKIAVIAVLLDFKLLFCLAILF